jgi:hypothetical protein
MDATAGSQRRGVAAALRKQDGMALILVLIVVLLLSLLGTTMLGNSSSELSIAGNYRNSEAAFYAAEAGTAFGSTYDAIYSALYKGGAGVTQWPAPGTGTILNPNNFSTGASSPDRNYNRITIPGTGSGNIPAQTADVKVELLGSGKLPAGTGTQEDSGLSPGTGFKANNFVVTVIGNGPNNSKALLETQVARIVQQ